MTLCFNGKYLEVSDVSRKNILDNIPLANRLQLAANGVTYIASAKGITTIYDMEGGK